MATRDEALKQMYAEMGRLKSYFPYRVIWGALEPKTLEVVTGANFTRRVVNGYMRKGYEGYTL